MELYFILDPHPHRPDVYVQRPERRNTRLARYQLSGRYSRVEWVGELKSEAGDENLGLRLPETQKKCVFGNIVENS